MQNRRGFVCGGLARPRRASCPSTTTQTRLSPLPCQTPAARQDRAACTPPFTIATIPQAHHLCPERRRDLATRSTWHSAADCPPSVWPATTPPSVLRASTSPARTPLVAVRLRDVRPDLPPGVAHRLTENTGQSGRLDGCWGLLGCCQHLSCGSRSPIPASWFPLRGSRHLARLAVAPCGLAPLRIHHRLRSAPTLAISIRAGCDCWVSGILAAHAARCTLHTALAATPCWFGT